MSLGWQANEVIHIRFFKAALSAPMERKPREEEGDGEGEETIGAQDVKVSFLFHFLK